MANPDLLASYEDPNEIVAACSAEALGRIGDRTILPRLQALEAACRRESIEAAME